MLYNSYLKKHQKTLINPNDLGMSVKWHKNVSLMSLQCQFYLCYNSIVKKFNQFSKPI